MPTTSIIDGTSLLANSLPKSGTHLLSQILEAFPEAVDYGTFWASMPSVTFRERTAEVMTGMIRRVAPSELMPAHLFYHAEAAEALGNRNVAHYFIYRDPRNMVVSEAQYLTRMRHWHRLHRYFAALLDDSTRVLFSITGNDDPGFPYAYPNVARRFERYREWLERDEVFAVRFEDLMGDGREEAIRGMVIFYLERGSNSRVDLDRIARTALVNIDAARSHTFRRGEIGGWRQVFTPHHREAMKMVAGDLVVELGYEEDVEW